jgi:DNA primase large subunit
MAINDDLLRERFALSEAKEMHQYLESEKDDRVISETAGFFQWDITPTREGAFTYIIHFANYLTNVARGRLMYSPRWKLVNRHLHQGQVSLTKREVCRLLQEEIRSYIESRTKGEPGETPSIIHEVINEIRGEFLKRKPHLIEFDQIILAEESEYPPCIKSLMDRATKGQHLSHVERLTLVTYLINQGVSTDGVINLFSNFPDFKEDKTRYQIEHLAGRRGSGTRYKPYNCSTLKTHGVCLNPNDPICKRIRNPLSYHVRRKYLQHQRKKPSQDRS